MLDGLEQIRKAGREDQARFVLDAVLSNPHHLAILEHPLVQALPEPFLMAGSIYKAVWNRLMGQAPAFGVNDYDLAYFDPGDLSEAGEATIAATVANAFQSAGIEVEACNQARVHIWFNRKFDTQREALSSSLQAVEQFASRTHAIGLLLDADGAPTLHAPYGYDELLSLYVRPAPNLSGAAAWNAKCDEQSRLWPGLRFQRA